MFWGRSRRPVVVVQHATQSLASLDRSIRVCRNRLGSNEPVAQPLMISFQMVQVDNLIPIVLKYERFVIRGIRGSGVLSGSMEHW